MGGGGDERAPLGAADADVERAAGGRARGEPEYADAGFLDIFKNFALLGWTAFGGPAAHIGLFQKLFIEDLKWASSEAFAELLALCQCLPGPSSTQMSFAIGTTKRGVLGGLLSGILFQYPGLVLMTVLGAFADDWAGTDVIDKHASLGGFVSGISAAGVALVASAAWGLGNKLCKDHDTKLISVLSAVVALYYVTGWIFPLLLLLGGIVTYFYRGPLPPADGEVSAKKAAAASGVQDFGVGRPVGAMLVAAWLAILGVGIALVASTDYDDWKELHWFEAFYRTGAIIWGGGQVVLPLLQHEVVKYATCCTDDAGEEGARCLAYFSAGQCTEAFTGGGACGSVEATRCTYVREDTWVTEEQFFAGLGLAQAMPGPLFNLAAFLGAAVGGVPGAGICWLGLFGPGVMLIFGVLPFWGQFRTNALYRRMLPGLNSAAVGLVFAAVLSMAANARAASSAPTYSTCVAVLAFYAAQFVKLPAGMWSKVKAPMVIVAGGALGALGGAVGAY